MLILVLITAARIVLSKTELQGHLEPLGNHVPHDTVITVRDFPLPLDFFRGYSSKGTPLVFKSVVGKSKMRKWSDYYLMEHFGDDFVSTLRDKRTVRRGGKTKTRTLSSFLNAYLAEDIYMVQNISEQMIPDMNMPRSIQCGGLQDHVEEIILQMSIQRTTSSLHLESVDVIHCILDGTEDLVLVDRKFKEFVEADGWNRHEGYSSIDVDKVDMKTYPNVRYLSTFKVTLNAGDCIFIPFRWYRQITAYGFRNVMLNYMISHVPWFNNTNCKYVDLTRQMTPFRRFVESSRQDNIRFLSRVIDEQSDHGVPVSMFLRRYVKEDLPRRQKAVIVKFIDLNRDKTLQWEELLSINVTDFMDNFYYQLVITDGILEKCFDCDDPGDHLHPGEETHDEF